MDFAQAKHDAAREIALAFGVSPMLLGLRGDNTYANYAEANRAFWRQTIIPLVQRTQKSFEAWLSNDWPDIKLSADLDRLDALAGEREAEWRRVGAAGFLSDDEKRAAVGYGSRPSAPSEITRRYSPEQPRDGSGRWAPSNSQALNSSNGGGGRGGAGVSRRICPKLDGSSIDGAVCLSLCPNGNIVRFPASLARCPNTIFNFEGY